MHDRSILGPADVSDSQLGAMVAASYGVAAEHVALCDSRAVEVDYDLSAITTAGRYWVRGEALVCGRPAAFSLFVKHVQSWSRSPLFAGVPQEMRAMAEASVPWRTEPLAYRSDLGDRLPDGLTMPRALGVFDLDAKSSALWLEEVRLRPAPWDHDRYARAAHLIGRMAASERVRPLAGVGGHPFTVHDYLFGRLNGQVLPMLHDKDIWRHPLVAGAFDASLSDDLLRAAGLAQEYVDELAAFPIVTCHGDACPNNLLAAEDDEDGFVLIDYGFWGPLPVGFDLGQLLVGDVQVGRRPADDLAVLDELIVSSYVEGLRAEGCDIPADVVRRAHALHLMVFTGLSTLPFEHLGSPVTPELTELVAQRAAIARFSLDLLQQTG
jgi:hypothetical protein